MGKSTLCTGLAAALPGQVDHFREEEVLTRPAFSAVAAEFRTGPVSLPTFLSPDATYRFVNHARWESVDAW